MCFVRQRTPEPWPCHQGVQHRLQARPGSPTRCREGPRLAQAQKPGLPHPPPYPALPRKGLAGHGRAESPCCKPGQRGWGDWHPHGGGLTGRPGQDQAWGWQGAQSCPVATGLGQLHHLHWAAPCPGKVPCLVSRATWDRMWPRDTLRPQALHVSGRPGSLCPGAQLEALLANSDTSRTLSGEPLPTPGTHDAVPKPLGRRPGWAD